MYPGEMDIRPPKILAGRDHPAYKNQHLSQQAFEKLNQMRKMGKLCDVTLLAGDVEISAHRAVLASCSPYFYAMFTVEMAESKAKKVTLQQIDPTALSMLIDFVYTSEIHVTEDNVQTLLSASNLLQLIEVQEACCEFLQSQLHPSNCLGIKAFADLHDCTDLHIYTRTYIEQHFSEVVHYDEFLSLSAPQVGKLIASDRLTVPSEEQVFEAVLSWIEHDVLNRQHNIAELMEHVRLPLMSREFLVQRVESEPMIKSNNQCKDLLIEAMKYHLLKAEQKILFKTPRTLPRTPIGLPKLLLVFGGQAPKAIKSVECYDFKEERWFQLAEMPLRRCRCGVAVINGQVFVVGGFSGSLRVRTVDAYNPVKDTWVSCPSMKARRSTLGVALLNDLIYAVGGFDGSSGLDSVECYDVKTDMWRTIASMSIRRSSVGVGVVAGLLYAVGGYDGCSRQCLSTVECHDAETNTWRPVAEMSCRRSGAGVGVLDGLLYAVGGHDGPLVRKSVEVYNPEKNVWSPVSHMHLCRRNAGVVTNDGLLYVIGGDDGSSNLGSVECYDVKTNKWTLLPSSMMTGRSYAGVAVIDKPII